MAFFYPCRCTGMDGNNDSIGTGAVQQDSAEGSGIAVTGNAGNLSAAGDIYQRQEYRPVSSRCDPCSEHLPYPEE